MSLAPLAFGTSNSGDANPELGFRADTSISGVSKSKSEPVAVPSMSILGSRMPEVFVSTDPS